MMVLGLLLILCVMYLPNGLATLWQRKRAATPAAEAGHVWGIVDHRRRDRALWRPDRRGRRERHAAYGRAHRHHRAQRRGQDHLLQRHLGRAAPHFGHAALRGRRPDRQGAAPLCGARHCAHLSDAARVPGHDSARQRALRHAVRGAPPPGPCGPAQWGRDPGHAGPVGPGRAPCRRR